MMSPSTYVPILVLLAGCAVPATAADENAPPPRSRAARSVPAAAQPVVNPEINDRRFLEDVAGDALLELELAKLAMQKSGAEPVRRLAQRLSDDHKASSEHIKAIAEVKGIALPDVLDAKRRKDYERLQKLSGTQFDQAYVKLSVEGHQQDIREFRREVARGVDPDIRSYAVGTLPKLHDHLAIARDTSRSNYLVEHSKKPPPSDTASDSARNATAGTAGNDISGNSERVR